MYLPELGEDFYRHGEALHAPVKMDAETITALHVCLTFDPDTPDLPVTVDCAEPHGYERIAPTLDLGLPGGEYPGEDAAAVAGEEYCAGVVTDFVGGLPEEIIVSWNQPTEETWEQGDRVIICGAEVVGGRVAGSLQGVGDQIEVIPFIPGEDDPAIDSYADQTAA